MRQIGDWRLEMRDWRWKIGKMGYKQQHGDWRLEIGATTLLSSTIRYLLSAFFICYLLSAGFTGCAKKRIVKPTEPTPVIPTVDEPSLRGKEYKKTAKLETVYFDYDDVRLKADTRTVLSKNAEWLKNNPDVEIIVEGHCDERGTTDYNMVLGDRRAKSVRRYLIKLGIKGNRIATISYGEEKPVDFGHDESAWAKNRRGELFGRIPPEEKQKVED